MLVGRPMLAALQRRIVNGRLQRCIGAHFLTGVLSARFLDCRKRAHTPRRAGPARFILFLSLKKEQQKSYCECKVLNSRPRC